MSDVEDLGRIRREREAVESNDGTKWTPEDALKSLLEDIEMLPEGEKPDKMVVIVRKQETPTEYGEMWRMAGMNVTEALGVVERWKIELIEDLA